MADQFTPQEQQLIERLRNAPQPTLNESRFEAIRAQMLNAMDTPPPPAPRLGPSTPIITVVALTVTVVIVIAVFSSGILSPHPAETPIPTAAPEATLEVTTEVTPEATAEITAEATLDTVIVIEGPVQIIDGNLITVYGVTIQLDSDDPTLKTLEVGDVVRVEADSSQTVITAISVTPVVIVGTVNPASGEIWRDDGTCDHPPPDWAPANGWRRRCQGQTQGNQNDTNGRGKGNGNG
jgi:hypothetical protein